MSWTRRKLIAAALASVGRGGPSQTNAAEPEARIAIHPGPFSARDESFASYKCPDWFRDAKFGIWAHWGPSSAIGDGDWYARNMYIQDHPQYKYHLEHYGHPTKFGFKDIIPTWKGDKFDPDHLMALYKKAGAKYFFSMGVHHDNFDLWNSTYHRWNATVEGLAAVPADERPPVNVVRFAFQTMVGIGTLFALLGVLYVATWIRRKRLPESTWFYRALVVAAPLSVVALIAGWVVTEVGRQPWVVYRVMPTAAAVTGASGIPVGYATLAASYLLVAIGLAWALVRLSRRPLALPAEPSPGLEPA